MKSGLRATLAHGSVFTRDVYVALGQATWLVSAFVDDEIGASQLRDSAGIQPASLHPEHPPSVAGKGQVTAWVSV